MANNHVTPLSVCADLTVNLQAMPKSLLLPPLNNAFHFTLFHYQFFEVQLHNCMQLLSCVFSCCSITPLFFHFFAIITSLKFNCSALLCNLSRCNFSLLLVHMPLLSPPLLAEVCQPGKHVMMRPDPLALSLLAAHQAVLLPQSATNPSDYITLSREALLRASVYPCVCVWVHVGRREGGTPISSSLFCQQKQVPVVFLACPPTKMDHQPLSWALCGCGSDHCYSVTVLIVVWLSDPAAWGVGGSGGLFNMLLNQKFHSSCRKCSGNKIEK